MNVWAEKTVAGMNLIFVKGTPGTLQPTKDEWIHVLHVVFEETGADSCLCETPEGLRATWMSEACIKQVSESNDLVESSVVISSDGLTGGCFWRERELVSEGIVWYLFLCSSAPGIKSQYVCDSLIAICCSGFCLFVCFNFYPTG